MDIHVDNNDNNEVIVIGGDNAESTEVAKADALEDIKDDVTKTDDLTNPKKETTTDDDETKKVETPKPDDVKKEQIEDDGAKPFKVSFGKKEETTATTKTETKEETLSVTENMVVDFMKTKGIEVENIAQLSKTVEIPDEVAKFMKFHQETGRGHSDFFNSQKDWTGETKDDTIKAFLKMNNDLSDEDVEKHFGLLEITEDEKETLSERDLTRRELEYDDKYREALGYMTSKSQEYKTSLGNRDVQKPLTEQEIVDAHKPYWARRDKSLDALNEVNMSLGDMGDISVSLDQGQKDLISKYTETQDAFFARFRNDKGEIDTDKSNESVMWGIKEVRESMLSDIFEQTYALVVDSISKKNRNVDLGDIKKQVHTEIKQGGVEEFGGNTESGMGTSILS